MCVCVYGNRLVDVYKYGLLVKTIGQKPSKSFVVQRIPRQQEQPSGKVRMNEGDVCLCVCMYVCVCVCVCVCVFGAPRHI